MLEVLQTSPAQQPPQITEKISFEDYLTKYEGQYAEWIDGEVFKYMSASDRHQDLVRFFTAILTAFIEEHDLGVIRTGPMSMKLEDRGREPDIFFVSKNNLDRLKKNYLDGAANLIIEIISPESRGRDRGDKFYEYEKAGVKEYWLIDYERRQAEFYRLGADNFYHFAQADDDQIFHSECLENLQINVRWLWQEKLPTLLEVLEEWKLI